MSAGISALSDLLNKKDRRGSGSLIVPKAAAATIQLLNAVKDIIYL